MRSKQVRKKSKETVEPILSIEELRAKYGLGPIPRTDKKASE